MTKIEALQKTIYNLENDVYRYNWYSANNCNCGVVARTLLNGRLPDECGFKKGWSHDASCLTSNMPLPEVWQLLKDAGFTEQDILDLEHLGGSSICNRAGLEVSEYDDCCIKDAKFDRKENLLRYMKAWVELLSEEQEQRASVATKPDSKEEAGNPK